MDLRSCTSEGGAILWISWFYEINPYETLAAGHLVFGRFRVVISVRLIWEAKSSIVILLFTSLIFFLWCFHLQMSMPKYVICWEPRLGVMVQFCVEMTSHGVQPSSIRPMYKLTFNVKLYSLDDSWQGIHLLRLFLATSHEDHNMRWSASVSLIYFFPFFFFFLCAFCASSLK